MPAGDLKQGMHLLGRTGTTPVVTTVVAEAGKTMTFNLDVDGPDTFFVVTGDVAALVHNTAGQTMIYGTNEAQLGRSAVYNTMNYQQVFDKAGAAVITKNPQHHFYFNAWLKANYTGLRMNSKSWFFFPVWSWSGIITLSPTRQGTSG